MRFRILRLAAAIFGMAISIHGARASLVGSTYDFNLSKTGSTVILSGSDGFYTDPANPSFCIGPALGCARSSGLAGDFTFTDLSPTLATVRFSFSGSTFAATGSFLVDLTDFTGLDGAKITNVSRASGNLKGGSTFNVSSFDATAIDFVGRPSGSYDALGGAVVVFDVTEAVPEPASVATLGVALLGLATVRTRRRGS